MSSITVTTPKFKKTLLRLDKLKRADFEKILNEYGKKGVSLLQTATPVDTAKTAQAWGYLITRTGEKYRLTWFNDSIADNNVPIVIMLHYGHATKNGGYVSGRDFINPTLRPLYDELHQKIIAEVRR